MDKEKITTAIINLKGLSYHDWKKVKMAVDGQFRLKKIKYERDLKLDFCEDVVASILREFE